MLSFQKLIGTTLGGWACFSSLAIAQVTSDGSLNTAVNGAGDYVITGGTATRAGHQASSQNLFHSFENFSLSIGESAVFDLGRTPSIENVFARVTGRNLSNIDGTLAVEGAEANLFLLNPAGIIFGENVQLSLPASFLATTADGLMFGNGFGFGVSTPQVPPLLTVSAPVGLQMGASAGGIQVNGMGHTLAKLDQMGRPSLVAPTVQIGPTRGLQVSPGQGLTLIGSGIALEGGVLTAPGGYLELGSVGSGERVVIAPDGTVDYSEVVAFGDVTLTA